jgi:hypothetical protein
MQDWYLYSHNDFSVRLPRQLKLGHPVRNGVPSRLFKGRLTRSDPKSELWIVIEPDIDQDMVAQQRHGLQKPPAITEWAGTTWEYRYRGESVTLPGGMEAKVTMVNPSPHGRGHSWNITFPCGGRWVIIRIDNMAGGLTWEQMEAVGSEIIRSFQFREADSGTATEPSGPVQASQGEGVAGSASAVDEEDVEWFACDGGPHLILPRSLRRRWRGVENLADVLDPRTDYGRACAVAPPVGLIPVGDGAAVVLAGSPAMTGWRHSPHYEGVDFYVLEDLRAAGPDGLVEAALSALALNAIVDTGLRLMLKKAGLILMFAGDASGGAAYGEVGIATPPGVYRIMKAHHEGAEGSLWVIRLRPATEAG